MPNKDNRVLSRTRARELSVEETRVVNGGIGTLTACTISASGAKDGDASIGEC
jgi:hypothetical protein